MAPGRLLWHRSPSIRAKTTQQITFTGSDKSSSSQIQPKGPLHAAFLSDSEETKTTELAVLDDLRWEETQHKVQEPDESAYSKSRESASITFDDGRSSEFVPAHTNIAYQSSTSLRSNTSSLSEGSSYSLRKNISVNGLMVATVVIYDSYDEVLRAMKEAEAYDRPALVLAYLPYTKKDDRYDKILEEVMAAVQLGYEPLYKWDPSSVDGESMDASDSDSILQQLRGLQTRTGRDDSAT